MTSDYALVTMLGCSRQYETRELMPAYNADGTTVPAPTTPILVRIDMATGRACVIASATTTTTIFAQGALMGCGNWPLAAPQKHPHHPNLRLRSKSR